MQEVWCFGSKRACCFRRVHFQLVRDRLTEGAGIEREPLHQQQSSSSSSSSSSIRSSHAATSTLANHRCAKRRAARRGGSFCCGLDVGSDLGVMNFQHHIKTDLMGGFKLGGTIPKCGSHQELNPRPDHFRTVTDQMRNRKATPPDLETFKQQLEHFTPTSLLRLLHHNPKQKPIKNRAHDAHRHMSNPKWAVTLLIAARNQRVMLVRFVCTEIL